MSIDRSLINVNDRTFLINASTTAGQRTAIPSGGQSFRYLNVGTVPVFVRSGDSTVTVTIPSGTPVATDGVPLAPGGLPESFGINPAHTHLAHITASGTAFVYITQGDGV